MEHLISLFFRSIFVDNMIFAFFLGMCSFLAVSKNVKTSLGLGAAVTFVLLVTTPANYLLLTKVLGPDCLADGVDLTYRADSGDGGREILSFTLWCIRYLPSIDCR